MGTFVFCLFVLVPYFHMICPDFIFGHSGCLYQLAHGQGCHRTVRARKDARDHRLPRAINYGAVYMESLHIGRGSIIRREIARVIALPRAIGVRAPRCSVTSLHGDLEIKKKFVLFQCHIFMLFVYILFFGSRRAFTSSWPMGLRLRLRLGLRSRLRFRLWVLHPHGLHRRPTARCACFFCDYHLILTQVPKHNIICCSI